MLWVQLQMTVHVWSVHDPWDLHLAPKCSHVHTMRVELAFDASYKFMNGTSQQALCTCCKPQTS